MSLKQLSMRIRSTTSTAKITKAMKMVAAAKLKTAERMMLAARPFAQSTRTLMDSILTPSDEDETKPESLLTLENAQFVDVREPMELDMANCFLVK